MRIIQALVLFLLFSCVSQNHEEKNIKIKKVIFDLNFPSQKSEFDWWVSKNIIENPNDTTSKKYESLKEYRFDTGRFGSLKCDFEDDNFEIYSGCAGEFGGALYFLDKKNPDKIYHLPITCPQMIDFQKDKYLITATLAHMSGSAAIYILNNPRDLPLISREKLLTDELIIPENIIECILDTLGVTANIYYPFKGKAFLVYAQNDTTYLGEIVDKRIINREIILSNGISPNDNKLNRIKNGIYISDINQTSISISQGLRTTEEIEGSIYLKQDTLVLGYKYSKIIKEEQ